MKHPPPSPFPGSPSRRVVLSASLAWLGTAAAGTAATMSGTGPAAGTDPVASLLACLLPADERWPRLGRKLAGALSPGIAAEAMEHLGHRCRRSSPEDLTPGQCARWVARDFADGRVLELDGLVFSHTEAAILLHLGTLAPAS